MTVTSRPFTFCYLFIFAFHWPNQHKFQFCDSIARWLYYLIVFGVVRVGASILISPWKKKDFQRSTNIDIFSVDYTLYTSWFLSVRAFVHNNCSNISFAKNLQTCPFSPYLASYDLLRKCFFSILFFYFLKIGKHFQSIQSVDLFCHCPT